MKMYHDKYKGAGVRKLYKAICKRSTGISEREVSNSVNSMQKSHRLKPTYMNKAVLDPVKSSGVMN